MIDELAATYPVIVGAEAWATHADGVREDAGAVPADHAGAVGAERGPARPRVRRRRCAPGGGSSAAMRAALDVDVLVLPTTRLRATPIGAETVGDVPVRPSMLGLTLPFNLTGWPAASVPGRVGAGELPVGVQVVGVRLEERGVLRVAAALHA